MSTRTGCTDPLQREPRSAADPARETGLALCLVALLVAWFAESQAAVLVAIVLLLVVMVFPAGFRPLAGPWFALAGLLGEISSRVVLTLLFFLVVTPIGLLRRLTGADPMQLRQWRQGDASVMRQRDHRYRAEDLDKPY